MGKAKFDNKSRRCKSDSKSRRSKSDSKNRRSNCPSSSCDCNFKNIRYMTKDQLVGLCHRADRPKARRVIDKLRTYLIQLTESEGFDVDVHPGCFHHITSITPARYCSFALQDPDDHLSLAKLGIAKYNAKNSETEFEATKVERVNVNLAGNRVYYYITFDARDVKTGDVNTFQSFSYVDRLPPGEAYAVLCRPKRNS